MFAIAYARVQICGDPRQKEVSAQQGEVIHVTSDCNNGWFKAFVPSSGENGWIHEYDIKFRPSTPDFGTDSRHSRLQISQIMEKEKPGLALKVGAKRLPFISGCPVLGCDDDDTEPTAWYYGRCTGQVFLGADGYCVCKHVHDSGDIRKPCSKGNYSSLFPFYELNFKCKNPKHKTYEEADPKAVQAALAEFAMSVRDTKDAATSGGRLTAIESADYVLKSQIALSKQWRERAKEVQTRRPPSTSSFIDCA